MTPKPRETHLIGVYPMTAKHITTDRTAGSPYVLGKAFEAVKEAVAVEEYAATITELRRNRGRCPIHGGDSDAFAVYPEERRWWCFRCDEGGDVIDLCRAVEGGEVWEATASLSLRFGVELPTRPDRWHKRQGEKAKIREELRRGPIHAGLWT